MSVQPQPLEPTAKKPNPVTIFVNNKEVELPDRHVTGAEIKHAAGIPLDFKLYGPKGDEIANEQRIEAHPKEKFTAISGQDVS
jgi:hypothetical protein